MHDVFECLPYDLTPEVDARRPIADDDRYDALIVIPTVATPSVLLPTLDRLVEVVDGLRVKIVCVLNPRDPVNARRAKAHAAALPLPPNVTLDLWQEDGLRGFGGAANIGVRYAVQTGGLPPVVVIFNDDLVPVEGWLEGLILALRAPAVCYPAENPGPDGRRPARPVEDYGRIGLVGPTGNNVAGFQQVASAEEVARLGYDGLARRQRERHPGEVWTAEFVSGFCLAISRDCLRDVAVINGDSWQGPFDAVSFPVAGYEDNDLCVRVSRAGWRAAVAFGSFIGHLGHQTFDALFPEWLRGMRNRLAFYRKWRGETGRPQTVGATYRVRLVAPNDLLLWMHSLAAAASVLDGAGVLINGNPADIKRHPSWASAGARFGEREQAMLMECEGADSYAVAQTVRRWISDLAQEVRDASFIRTGFEVRVSPWLGAFDERAERNAAILIAQSIGFDWLLSIDHDEVIEERVSRTLLDRLMSHPDPLVESYEVAFANHWENDRMVRVDRPWGDGGEWRGGMMGPRLWRVNRAAPKQVTAGTAIGLHCGNSPLAVPPARKVASLRFRHFGYLGREQRARKFEWYSAIDPTPDPLLVGGETYGHIVQDEGMVLRPWVGQNGIGLSMLVHAGEAVEDVARWFDDLYSVVDAIVLVWTDEWTEEDRGWIGQNPDLVLDWPRTGPSRDLAYLAWVFGAEWTHRVLDDDLSGARNAGFAALRRMSDRGIGWGLFLDPDEWTTDYHAMTRGLRSMAETSDGWGWLFRFNNLVRGGRPAYSESVRLFRLDPQGIMRLNGRVHEGFDLAVEQIRESGRHPNFRYAPFVLQHGGLAKADGLLHEKLLRYRRGLVRSLEENPYQPGAWTALGLQFANDGLDEQAIGCFQRGMLCAGGSYLPYQEAARAHLRTAAMLLEQVLATTVRHHPAHRSAREVLDVLREAAPPVVRIGTRSLPPIDLPAFPLPEGLLDGSGSGEE
jgi:GT2 family glycosyltransferase